MQRDDGIEIAATITLPHEDAAFLPFNYLPAALTEVMGGGAGQNRIVLVLPEAEDLSRIDHAVIPADVLADPAATARFIRDLGLPPAADPDQQRIFLGPPTQRPASGGLSGLVAPVEPDPGQDFDRAVLVIDAGIAFWHPRFRGRTGPRFREVRFLDFDAEDGTLLTALDRAEIARLCQRADGEGQAAVVAELAARFPGSFHGEGGTIDLVGLWHGTAVADLAAGGAAGSADHVALFGLELPMALVHDSDGDSLTAMLALALGLAARMAAGMPGVPLTVVLPYGFTGGPQDGLHPAARVIDRILSHPANSAIQVVLPAGNHLQDRAHATLGAEGRPTSVEWWLPPDDHSVNTVEAVMARDPGRPGMSLGLQAPDGAEATLCLDQPGQVLILVRNGAPLGAALRLPDAGPWARLRLALARTAVEDDALRPTPHGRWRLSAPPCRPLDLWLLRDDRDTVADRARPRRPSWFSDAAYRAVDAQGAALQVDDAGSAVRRAGTLSVLATATMPQVSLASAQQRLGSGVQPAWYSGRSMAGAAPGTAVVVDDGWISAGPLVAANGGARRMRMSGTSAAAGLLARALALGTPMPDL